MYKVKDLGRKKNVHYRQLVFKEKWAGNPVSVALLELVGKCDGPTMLWVAVQHGMELNGSVVIQRLLAEIDRKKLSGRILAVPMANPAAFVQGSWHIPPEKTAWQMQMHWPLPRPKERIPEDTNMNRYWPGRADGNITEQIVDAINREAASHADFAVDLHSHFYWNTEVAILHVSSPEAVRFGRALGCRVNHRSDYDARILTRYLCGRGVPAVSVELVPTHIINQTSVAEGVRMLTNGLKHAGMLPGRRQAPRETYEFTYDQEKPLAAKTEGLLSFLHASADVVRKGGVLGEIFDPWSAKRLEEVRAPYDCLVSRAASNSYIKAGWPVCKIVDLKKSHWTDRS